MTCRIHRQVHVERMSHLQPDDPGPSRAPSVQEFTEHEHAKAGINNILGVLLLGCVAFAAIYAGVDWALHASGILPNR